MSIGVFYILAEFVSVTMSTNDDKCSWQEDKTLAECNIHMLQSGLLSDVTFDVAGESIQAHRYMLVSRSPVFETMFCGGLSQQTGTAIQIEDIELDTFRDFLR